VAHNETVSAIVGSCDMEFLKLIASFHSDHDDSEHRMLERVTYELASAIGELGLETSIESEEISFMDLDRQQRLVLSEAHELREYGQVFIRRH